MGVEAECLNPIEIMTAVIETGCQSKGSTTEQFDFLFYYLSKQAAEGIELHSLDSRVKCLSFLWRVDARFGSFEGMSVEYVMFGRRREWISVDWLIKEHEWQGKSLPELVSLLGQRLRDTPAVLLDACRKKKLHLDPDLLSQELSLYLTRMELLCAKFDPMTRWIMPAQRSDPSRFCEPEPLA